MKILFFKYKEIIMYLIMGVATTVVSWGTYAFFTKILIFLPSGSKIIVSNIISWIFAVLFAYLTNKVWVFESRNWSLSFVINEFVKFISARAATGIFEIVTVPLLVNLGLNATIFGIDGMISKIIVSIVVIVLNYILSKMLIFTSNKNSNV